MSETADRLRELAETVEFVEDEQGKEIRDIDVAFVQESTGLFSMFSKVLGGSPDRVPVFDLEIAPGDVDVDEDDLEDEDVDDEAAEIDLEDPTDDVDEPVDLPEDAMTATGDELDRLGELHDVERRDGEDDDEYRSRIRDAADEIVEDEAAGEGEL